MEGHREPGGAPLTRCSVLGGGHVVPTPGDGSDRLLGRPSPDTDPARPAPTRGVETLSGRHSGARRSRWRVRLQGLVPAIPPHEGAQPSRSSMVRSSTRDAAALTVRLSMALGEEVRTSRSMSAPSEKTRASSSSRRAPR